MGRPCPSQAIVQCPSLTVQPYTHYLAENPNAFNRIYSLVCLGFHLGSSILSCKTPVGVAVAKWLLLHFPPGKDLAPATGLLKHPLFCWWSLKKLHIRLPSPRRGIGSGHESRCWVPSSPPSSIPSSPLPNLDSSYG